MLFLWQVSAFFFQIQWHQWVASKLLAGIRCGAGHSTRMKNDEARTSAQGRIRPGRVKGNSTWRLSSSKLFGLMAHTLRRILLVELEVKGGKSERMVKPKLKRRDEAHHPDGGWTRLWTERRVHQRMHEFLRKNGNADVTFHSASRDFVRVTDCVRPLLLLLLFFLSFLFANEKIRLSRCRVRYRQLSISLSVIGQRV